MNDTLSLSNQVSPLLAKLQEANSMTGEQRQQHIESVLGKICEIITPDINGSVGPIRRLIYSGEFDLVINIMPNMINVVFDDED